MSSTYNGMAMDVDDSEFETPFAPYFGARFAGPSFPTSKVEVSTNSSPTLRDEAYRTLEGHNDTHEGMSTLHTPDDCEIILESTDRELLLNTGETTRKSHLVSRTEASLSRASPEPSEQDQDEVGQPVTKKPKLDDRASGSSFSTTRSSYDTETSARSSITSVGSDGIPDNNVDTGKKTVSKPTKPKSSKTSAPGKEKKNFICPKCNAGEGERQGRYRDQEWGYLKYKSQWNTAAALRRHLVSDHIDDFRSPECPKYLCRYCECDVSKRESTCEARFKNDHELIDHVIKFHSKDPRDLEIRAHCCFDFSNFDLSKFNGVVQ